MSPTVLVAHDSDTIREAIARLLAEAGYRVVTVVDGESALQRLEDVPAALIVDAALPGVFSFEVLDRVRARALPTKTILIASVYNRAGYKRRPTSLYGADDFVEQHHIPDLLLAKLATLLGLPAPDGEKVDAAVLRDTEIIRVAGEARLSIRYRNRDEGLLRAKRLARLIVADIALYNRALGSKESADEELKAGLREDLEEGRLLFDLRVPRELRDGIDFMGDALLEFYEGRAGAAAAAIADVARASSPSEPLVGVHR